ncbi:hypothetical protein [Leptolyngbya sp. FACHB-261]|uniref:hypothetical protein n=1 Tax=Leptolyngbya sp. FACHB-261 TaxID=2692806 RepID=UPI0016833499|nr:hypothetical protein [Leptolyngbya sp. FACHB-261]MBD2099788.1 hypothetical protein [Leptolyngbya sp. FACHB-261]
MPTYEEVLSLAKQLFLPDQSRLIEALSSLVHHGVAVEDTDEFIPAEEIAESETALQEYWTGLDWGMSSEALKQKLFG